MITRRLYTALLCGLALLLVMPGCKKQKKKVTKYPVEITSSPTGAKVFFADRELGKTTKKMKARPGTYRFRLEKAGYVPKWRLVSVKDKAVYEHIKLHKQTADVLISSSPSEAEVTVNGTVVGETPMVLKNQPVGKYTATVKKLGYAGKRISWEVKDSRPVKVSAQMYSNLGIVKIDSNPTGATVMINGKNCGSTPVKKRIEQGKHRVVVKKDGFSTFDDFVITRREETVSRFVRLHRLPASLRVASDPAGAKVFINGAEYGSTPFTQKNLQPGKYNVRVEKPGFLPITKVIRLRAGHRGTLNFELGANTGSIHLVANPPGVTIYLNGKVVGTTEPDDDGKFSQVFILKNLPAGAHRITVAHKRARPQKKTIRVYVKKGKVARPKTINMWIANAILKLKTGRKMVGCLRSETPLEVFFEPEPGVRQGFKRDEIEYLEMLKEKE